MTLVLMGFPTKIETKHWGIPHGTPSSPGSHDEATRWPCPGGQVRPAHPAPNHRTWTMT